MTAILVYIEDNPLNMRLIRRMLNTEDLTIYEASTGRAGLRLIEEHVPDIILMDINLPDVEGTEIARQVKADPRLMHIPIVALTANAMHGDRERFLESGCDGYIAKPVSRNELINTIHHFLEQHPPRQNKTSDTD